MPPKVFRAERLQALRKSRGLTLQALSELSGVAVDKLHRYETGQAEPTPYKIKALANTFNVSTDYLLGLTDGPKERIMEATLSADEQKFLQALREGRLRTLLGMLGEAFPNEQEQPNVPRRHITPHR